MRKILVLILFIYSVSIWSQNTISIHFSLCNNKESESVFENDYRIIYNDSLKTEFKTGDSHKLSDGKYRVEYNTYFGWKTTNSFLLFNDIYYSLDFCLDEVNAKPIDIFNLGIDSIKDGEELEINHNYSGCFNSGGEKILIQKIKNKYILSYNTITRKLKESEISFFKTYEIELINVNTNDLMKCTAFSQNIIKYGNHKFEYSESCPKWNGFEELKKKLKLK